MWEFTGRNEPVPTFRACPRHDSAKPAGASLPFGLCGSGRDDLTNPARLRRPFRSALIRLHGRPQKITLINQTV
jgi:hypothetical protein